MEKDLSQNILEKIKKEDIKPSPKFKFLLKNYVLWAMVGVSLLVGTLAVAVILFILLNQDWEIYRQLSDSVLSYAISVLPYFWFIIVLLFITVLYYNYKHTKYGYRYPVYIIVILYFVITAILGSTAYAAGLGNKVEQVLEKNVPLYQKINKPRYKIWVQPEKGLVAGVVRDVSSSSIFLMDFNKDNWEVNIGSMPPKLQKIIHLKLRPGDRIKVMGELIDKRVIQAREIRPWAARGVRLERIKDMRALRDRHFSQMK